VRLLDLDGRFIRREIRPCHVGAEGCSTVSQHSEHEFHVVVDTIDEADGVMFLCPTCFETNRGPVGTHQVLCWRPRVPDGIKPGPGRWEFLGAGLENLSLRAGSSSILLDSPCKAHFFVEDGAIRF